MPTHQELQQLALARLADAEVLYEAGRYDACVYLLGYAVEVAFESERPQIFVVDTARFARITQYDAPRGGRLAVELNDLSEERVEELAKDPSIRAANASLSQKLLKALLRERVELRADEWASVDLLDPSACVRLELVPPRAGGSPLTSRRPMQPVR